MIAQLADNPTHSGSSPLARATQNYRRNRRPGRNPVDILLMLGLVLIVVASIILLDRFVVRYDARKATPRMVGTTDVGIEAVQEPSARVVKASTNDADEPRPTSASEPTSEDPNRDEQKRRWAAVRDRFQAAQLHAAQYELDPALAIDYPAFNDVTVPEVSAMSKALRTASGLAATASGAPIGGSKDLLMEFENAVGAYETATDVAERAARRLRWGHLSESDRKDLEQLRSLLTHAESPGNTEVARHTYYAQLQKVARRLNYRHGAHVVPATAMAAIEARTRPQIEGTTTVWPTTPRSPEL